MINQVYSEVIEKLVNSLSTAFDEVYHSAEIIQTDAGRMPAIVNGDEWIDLSPTDQKEIVYVRRNGNDDMYEEFNVGSCIVSMKMKTPLRVVYFRDHTEYHDSVLARMLQTILIKNVGLQSVIRDKWKLLKEESSGDYNLGASTCYVGIDIFVYWYLSPDNCGNDLCCVDLENPVKKCDS